MSNEQKGKKRGRKPGTRVAGQRVNPASLSNLVPGGPKAGQGRKVRSTRLPAQLDDWFEGLRERFSLSDAELVRACVDLAKQNETGLIELLQKDKSSL